MIFEIPLNYGIIVKASYFWEKSFYGISFVASLFLLIVAMVGSVINQKDTCFTLDLGTDYQYSSCSKDPHDTCKYHAAGFLTLKKDVAWRTKINYYSVPVDLE